MSEPEDAGDELEGVEHKDLRREIRALRAQLAAVDQEVHDLAAQVGFDLVSPFGTTPITAIVRYLAAVERIALKDKRWEQERADAAEARVAEVEGALRKSASSYHHEMHFVRFSTRAPLEQCGSPVCKEAITALRATPGGQG